MRSLKEILTPFSIIRMLNIYCISVDTWNFSGENADQVRKVGLKFRRWRKAEVTWGDDHTKMTAGDAECERSLGGGCREREGPSQDFEKYPL